MINNAAGGISHRALYMALSVLFSPLMANAETVTEEKLIAKKSVTAKFQNKTFKKEGAICKSFLKGEMKTNNILFFKSNGNWIAAPKGKLGSPPQGNVVYYLRSNVLPTHLAGKTKSGGILMIKTGKKASGNNKNKVKLHIQKGRRKNVHTTDCTENLNKLKTLLKTQKNVRTFNIDRYQEYVNTKIGAKLGEKGEANDFMNTFHLHYREFVKKDCKLDTKTAGNRRQGSLLSHEAVGSGWLWGIIRALSQHTDENKALSANLKNQHWNVRMIPYDWNRKAIVGGRACIRVSVPNLRQAEYLRINDLAYKPAENFHGDTEWTK